MQQADSSRVRATEIATGIVTLLAVFGLLAALLLDFNFVSPYASLQEDLAFLEEQVENQQISTHTWLVAGAFVLLAIPFYLVCFQGRLKVLHFINGLVMLVAAAGFIRMGILGIELNHTLTGIGDTAIESAPEGVQLRLLDLFRKGQNYRLISSSLVGLFAMGLGLTRIPMRRYPVVSSVLLIGSGPVLIFFNWFDPGHLLRTVAMAGIIIGVAIYSVRLINRGL